MGGEHSPGVGQQPCALGGEADVAGGAYEQLGAQVVFETADVAAQCLLGHVQPGGGAREVEFLGGGDEGAQETGVEVAGHPGNLPSRTALTTQMRECGQGRCWTAVGAAGERRGHAPLRTPAPASPLAPAPMLLAVSGHMLVAAAVTHFDHDSDHDSDHDDHDHDHPEQRSAHTSRDGKSRAWVRRLLATGFRSRPGAPRGVRGDAVQGRSDPACTAEGASLGLVAATTHAYQPPARPTTVCLGTRWGSCLKVRVSEVVLTTERGAGSTPDRHR